VLRHERATAGLARVEVRRNSALMTVVWRTGGVAGGQESTRRPLRSRFDAVVVQSREFDVPGKDSLRKAQADWLTPFGAAVVPDADFRQRPVLDEVGDREIVVNVRTDPLIGRTMPYGSTRSKQDMTAARPSHGVLSVAMADLGCADATGVLDGCDSWRPLP